jgi:hypothetical protein
MRALGVLYLLSYRKQERDREVIFLCRPIGLADIASIRKLSLHRFSGDRFIHETQQRILTRGLRFTER